MFASDLSHWTKLGEELTFEKLPPQSTIQNQEVMTWK